MIRVFAILFATAFALVGCSAPVPQFGPDGQPLPKVYRILAKDTADIQFRMLDAINALRQARNIQPLVMNAELNAAAATHSRDMSVQNRPWHFGSDGSSPIERATRAGYTKQLLGEDISETYETELETLADWMKDPDTAGIIVDTKAQDMGFAFFQEPNGKIWWTLVTGG